MSLLPTDSFAAAAFLIDRMYRPVAISKEGRFFAVPETEHPIDGDTWFWSDDNAKVLEFLARPELWRRYPAESAEILRFVRAMCRGPFMFRRVSPPRLDEAERSEGMVRYRHSFLNLRSDLSRGLVVAGMRYHDGRNFDNVLFCNNRVEFTHRHRRFSIS